VPTLTIFAGPNGSGKSSLIRQVEFEGRENLLEPDAIAKRISPESPQQGGISAGREVLIRAAEYIRSRQSFAIETTLSGNWTNSTIREAMERSFLTRLFYICLNNPEWNIHRVSERVAQGGHDVPDEDVRRRYVRSIANAGRLLRIVQEGLVFDNSESEPRLIFEMRGGRVLNIANEIPAWAATLLEDPRVQQQ
jgi:predicted ABC-type ATPase